MSTGPRPYRDFRASFPILYPFFLRFFVTRIEGAAVNGAVMNYRRVTIRRQVLAYATLAIGLAGCSALPGRPADLPALYYYDIGDAWTTRKRRVHLYQCRSGALVCTGPASYLDVMYSCRCD